jgi:hypothetical protein
MVPKTKDLAIHPLTFVSRFLSIGGVACLAALACSSSNLGGGGDAGGGAGDVGGRGGIGGTSGETGKDGSAGARGGAGGSGGGTSGSGGAAGCTNLPPTGIKCVYDASGSLVGAQRCEDSTVYCGGFCIDSAGWSNVTSCDPQADACPADAGSD